MENERLKDIVWLGSSLDDVRSFPEDVREEVGYALYLAQGRGKHISAKPLSGIGRGASVMEIVTRDQTGTYRTVYTVQFRDLIYVLHAFQKKSIKGIATPRQEIDLVKARLKLAEQDHAQRSDQYEH